MHVGFIGLGMMGLPMAENLARAPGIALVAFDRASSGRNVASETKLAQFMIPGTFAGGFALKLQAKHLCIVASMLEGTHLDAPEVALCAGLWREASAVLGPQADNTEIYHFLESRHEAGTPREEAHAVD
ncbi:NAD-binding protein [Xanthobacter autotrophicus]|uniref:NAD-binding protein n=1 Tax=Xanthobacter autotrophicus TaxID=280 RepID=UPI00372B9840